MVYVDQRSFKTNCVMTYNTMSNLQRLKKSDFFDKLYDDQFSKLQIKRFCLKSRNIFVRQEIGKDKIIKLFKSIMTAKKKLMMKVLELIKLL